MKLPKGYKEYFEDLSEYEGLNEEEAEYITRFYLEFYNDAISFGEAQVLKSPDMIKEARKNHNSVKRDAYRVAKKRGRMLYGTNEYSIDEVQLDSLVKPEEPWRKIYKIGGYELAGKHIVSDTIEAIINRKNDSDLTSILLNMLLTFRELKLVYRKDKREKRQNEKS